MRGAELRVRPVVMTSLTAALGLLPGGHRDLDRLAGPEAAGASWSSARCSARSFLTRYLMPVLYSFFPAPAGHGECKADLILGSHYTDRFLHPRIRRGIGSAPRSSQVRAIVRAPMTRWLRKVISHEDELETTAGCSS